MKPLIPTLLLILLAVPRTNAAVTVTSPAGGNSSTYDPFLAGPERYQQVYSASDFLATVPAGFITQMAFAPASTIFAGAHITNVQVRFSTTLASPSSLSPVFANNVGPDQT